MSSIYTSAPEPAADGSNQVDVARALKQTSEALIRKTEELEATIKELQSALNVTPPEDTASIITDSQPFPNGGNLTPASDIVDPILDRAIELQNAALRQAQAETKSLLAAFQTALDNFKAGYDDTNAVVNATIYELSAQVGGNTARITEEELVRATSTQALAGRVGKITSVVNGNSAAITTEAVTRANADSALSALITTVEAQTNSNTAAIQDEVIARTDADNALGSQITSVEVKANAATANGSYGITATAGTNGATAEFAVQVRATSGGTYANAGMNIQVFSAGNSRIKFYANQFIVTTGPDAYQPFAISGGVVYANDLMVGNANIVNGSITNAKIGDAEITNAKIANATITSAKIVSLSADKISAGTIQGVSLLITDSTASNYILRANFGGSAGCDLWKPFMQLGFSYNLYDPSVPGLRGYAPIDSVGVYGYAYGSAVTNHGIRGTHTNGSSGLIATANGYDFYAEGTGVNYGPFTGAHDVVANLGDTFEIGDLVVDVECVLKRNISNTLFRVEKSTTANQRGVVGVVANLYGLLANNHIPAVFDQVPVTPEPIPSPDGEQPVVPPPQPANNEFTPIWNAVKTQYNYMAVNALGEGQINVCGEGGDLAVGDLICASSMLGKGMRQSDDLLHNYTVARAREAVTFSSPTEVKVVACIYLCG